MNYRTILATSVVTAVVLGTAVAPLMAVAEDATASTNTSTTGDTTTPKPTLFAPRPELIREKLLASTTAAGIRNDMLEKRPASSTLPRQADVRAQEMKASTTAARMEKQVQRQSDRLAKAHERASQEIDRRVAALEAFTTRVGNVHLSDADKESLKATMQGQINTLMSLKDKIENDTSTSTLKDAVQSITKSYRVFALVIPKGAIIAAADRVSQVVAQMEQFSTKLGARIATAQAAGSDVSALSSSLSDFDAKVADATAQAQAAVAEVNVLSPDNGDQTVLQANKAALQDAHKKLQAAQQDLKDARKDAETIVKGLKARSSTDESGTASTTAAQ